MASGVEQELSDAVARVLASHSRKKLVVAGPGAGKTTLFRRLLDQADGDASRRLILTFINNLKADLDRSLGDVAEVFTLHGYCQHAAPIRRPQEGTNSGFRLLSRPCLADQEGLAMVGE